MGHLSLPAQAGVWREYSGGTGQVNPVPTDACATLRALDEARCHAVANASGSALAERLSVGGIELEVVRRGTGRPLLLLHGAQTVDPRARFLDLLGAHAEIIALRTPASATRRARRISRRCTTLCISISRSSRRCRTRR